MENKLTIYNTLNRQKELFVPLHAPHVGMYVCGPTVYGDAHLGHARPAITFDILFRYLTHLGYKVRYVRNITDVGHLEHDADEGEDKIAKKARLEQLEPMEVVQYYLNRYHKAMEALNVLPPSIEPHASGHIIEQIELVKEILKNGYAYESEGSVYFDVAKYNKDHHYGKLSGRNLDDVLNTTRELDGQSEKHNPADFRSLEMCATRTHHALAYPVEQRLSRLALRMYRHGQEILGRALRYSWRRHGPYLPASRMQDCTIRSFTRGRYGTLLDAQQHADRERTENG